MPLIATSTDEPGVARIFFDLRPTEPAPDEQARIATAIEHAFALAASARSRWLEPLNHAA